jgi:sulfur relay (sulfurtransferase) complex TusBCD TusD component (DsrE family)
VTPEEARAACRGSKSPRPAARPAPARLRGFRLGLRARGICESVFKELEENTAVAKISRFVIMVSEAPYDSLKPYTALRYARSAKKRNLDTKIIFYADGVFCVKKGTGQGSEAAGDFETKIVDILKEGIRVEACAAPMRIYAFTQQDLIAGVTVAEDVISHTLDEQTRVIWL